MRMAQLERKTNETEVFVQLNIDGNGKSDINLDYKFFKHMLEQFSCHSGIDLSIKATSLDGDEHHLVEDVAIALGSALNKTFSDKLGINRYGNMILPMDDALVLSSVDLSGRPFSKISVNISDEKISDFTTSLLPHFFKSLALNSNMTIHIKQLDGDDPHHIVEAVFKSYAKALKQAISKNGNSDIPSTKGIL